MIVSTLENTDHSFANQNGRAAVEQEVETWLAENFPVTRAKPVFSRDEQLQSTEGNPVTLGVPVPAYVSSGKIGAI
jgi:hypothetical protein